MGNAIRMAPAVALADEKQARAVFKPGKRVVTHTLHVHPGVVAVLKPQTHLSRLSIGEPDVVRVLEAIELLQNDFSRICPANARDIMVARIPGYLHPAHATAGRAYYA